MKSQCTSEQSWLTVRERPIRRARDRPAIGLRKRARRLTRGRRSVRVITTGRAARFVGASVLASGGGSRRMLHSSACSGVVRRDGMGMRGFGDSGFGDLQEEKDQSSCSRERTLWFQISLDRQPDRGYGRRRRSRNSAQPQRHRGGRRRQRDSSLAVALGHRPQTLERRRTVALAVTLRIGRGDRVKGGKYGRSSEASSSQRTLTRCGSRPTSTSPPARARKSRRSITGVRAQSEGRTHAARLVPAARSTNRTRTASAARLLLQVNDGLSPRAYARCAGQNEKVC